ncbi:MAG: glutamate-5-semialdehyde dehydrogenase [Candidatus Omnitrophota bacterium]|nr:MAG: glutamate-5-semialdehyde dehydrogenase [Candidatus Omnitrophota bacterium]
MDNKQEILNIAKKAKKASRVLAVVSETVKNKTLLCMADSLIKNTAGLIRANEKDLHQAKRRGKPSAFLDRLVLNEKRIAQMSESLKSVATLKDPVGEVIKSTRRPNGLLIKKVRVPIGVVAIIYEARPGVTSDSIGLCLKSGNAVILRGGREAINSNIAIFNILRRCLVKYKLPPAAINLVKSTDRKAIDILLSLKEFIDLVIPRGGQGLIELVERKSMIPVIKHYKGICHIYVDNQADLSLARKVVFNAKVQRPGVCNAMETLLVHQALVREFLPIMLNDLQAAGVEIRADAQVCKMNKAAKRATERDWSTEYLDLILSVKVVRDLKEALEHISRYGSGHSDAIITENRTKAKEFLTKVDSACVYVNASTRFTDGYEFGLGAEMGISTDKLHARGPMGLEELTTYKYEIFGRGQIRS